MTLKPSRQKSATARWTGRVLSGLVIAFLLFDAAGKLVPIKPVMEGMQQLGFQSTVELARGLGLLLLTCTFLYAVPRTAVLGAVLLTGFLGGTIAVHLRAGDPILSHVLFGGYVGCLLWAGLFLRNGNVWRWFRPEFYQVETSASRELKNEG
jgi:hypothetical protein